MSPTTPQLAILALLALPLAAQPQTLIGLVPRGGTRTSQGLIAFDSARERLVELGSQGDTREFDGTSLLQRPGVGPRLFGALSYRSAAGRTLAFGLSYDSSLATFVTGTWEYSGATWQLLPTGTSPSAGGSFAMTYDSMRDRVVLFGGTSGSLSSNTWEWDGVAWTQRTFASE